MLARERSPRVNQWLKKTISPGSTTLSTTPSAKRSANSSGRLVMTPVSEANAPHSSSPQKISRFALRDSA